MIPMSPEDEAPTCDLCGGECSPSDYIETVDFTICARCTEELLVSETTEHARSAVGMVGGGY